MFNKKMNIKMHNILIICCLVIILLSSCSHKKSTENEQFKQSENLNVEKIWNEKIRFLCETNCDDFDNPNNLKKDYILEVCKYYKMLSDTNIEYNGKIQKYIISEIEVKDIVNKLLGIDNFKFDDETVYDKAEGRYIFSEYESFFDDKIYENKTINKLDDERLEFKLNVSKNSLNNEHIEKYILKKNSTGDYYITAKSSIDN